MNDEIEGFSVDPSKDIYLLFGIEWVIRNSSYLIWKKKKSIAIRLDQSKADHVYSGAWSKSGKQLMLAIEDGTLSQNGVFVKFKIGFVNSVGGPQRARGGFKTVCSISLDHDTNGLRWYACFCASSTTVWK